MRAYVKIINFKPTDKATVVGKVHDLARQLPKDPLRSLSSLRKQLIVLLQIVV